MSQQGADLVSVAVVDERGRITFDNQMREMADIRKGDKLRLSLVMTKGHWMIAIVGVEAK